MDEWLDLSEPRPVRLTVDDFLLLAEAGAFNAYRGTELIDGVVVEMSPMTNPHALLVGDVYFRLRTALATAGSPLAATLGSTVRLPPHDAPEPDIMVTRRSSDRYLPQEAVLLAVEVSFSTLANDLSRKRGIYARGGIPELWVVDGVGRQVHQFWAPADGGYAQARVVPLSGPLESATLPGLRIDGAGM